MTLRTRLCRIYTFAVVFCLQGRLLSFKSDMRRERSWFGAARLESALSHSTIKVYVSAISACHEGLGERLVFNILSWTISSKSWGGNVWWCVLRWEQPRGSVRSPFRLSRSGLMGRSCSGYRQLGQHCRLLESLGALLFHLGCTLFRGDRRGATPFQQHVLIPLGGSQEIHVFYVLTLADMLLWSS